jgi:hypothetical protein
MSERKYDVIPQDYFIVSCVKIVGYGNPGNKLESPCIMVHFEERR